MNALHTLGQTTQQVVCMLMATVIVAASLSLGAYGAESMLHEGYSVTVTQLQ